MHSNGNNTATQGLHFGPGMATGHRQGWGDRRDALQHLRIQGEARLRIHTHTHEHTDPSGWPRESPPSTNQQGLQRCMHVGCEVGQRSPNSQACHAFTSEF